MSFIWNLRICSMKIPPNLFFSENCKQCAVYSVQLNGTLFTFSVSDECGVFHRIAFHCEHLISVQISLTMMINGYWFRARCSSATSFNGRKTTRMIYCEMRTRKIQDKHEKGSELYSESDPHIVFCTLCIHSSVSWLLMNANVPVLFFFLLLLSVYEAFAILHAHVLSIYGVCVLLLANKSFSVRGRSSRAFFWAGEIEAECLDKFYICMNIDCWQSLIGSETFFFPRIVPFFRRWFPSGLRTIWLDYRLCAVVTSTVHIISIT